MLELDGETVSDSFIANERNGKIFLPLCATAEALSLAISCQGQRAFGFVIEESRPVVVDLEEGFVVSERKVYPTGKAAFANAGEIWVEMQELSRWLPLEFSYRPEASAIEVRAREVLPLQAARKRQKQVMAQVKAPQVPKLQDFTPRRRALSLPTIDFTTQEALTRSAHEATKSSTLTSLELSGDLFYLSGVAHLIMDDERLKRLDLSLIRRTETPLHLGPLPVTQLVLGTVPIPSIDGIGGGTTSLAGFLLSNRPLIAASNFLTHEMSGYLPDGWDAELLHNGAPIAYQPPTPDGRYRFENLRVNYGVNTFEVVLHGPFGEVRRTTQTFFSDAITPTGAFLYTVAAGVRTGLTESSTLGNDIDSNVTMTTDFGLTENLSGTTLYQHETDRQGAQADYLGLGVRTAWGYTLISGDVIQSFSPSGKSGQLLTVRSSSRDFYGVALQLEQRAFHDFESRHFPASNDPLVTQTVLKGGSSLAVIGDYRLPVAADLTLNTRRSGDLDGSTAWYISGGWNGWNAALEASAAYLQRCWKAASVVQVNTRVNGFNVRGQAGFTLFPSASASAINISAEKDLGGGYQLQSGVTHDPESGVAEFRGGVVKSYGPLGYLVSATTTTNGGYSVKAGVSTAVARDRWNGQTVISAGPLSPYGMIAVSATNAAAGDEGHREIPGIGYLVNGRQAIVVRGTSGAPVIAFLEPDIPVDVVVDPSTVEDPFMVPLQDGCHIVPRAGVVSACRFTMTTGGEIDGMIYAKIKGGQVPLKGVKVDLVRVSGGADDVVASTLSQESGYFLFKAVRPGVYLLFILEEEVKRLGTAPAAPVVVGMPEGGDQVTGKDFVLEVVPSEGKKGAR